MCLKKILQTRDKCPMSSEVVCHFHTCSMYYLIISLLCVSTGSEVCVPRTPLPVNASHHG